MDIRFGDHASFHRAALGMTAGSAALGIALHAATPTLASVLGGLFGIAVGATAGYGKPALRFAAAAVASAPLVLLKATSLSWAVLAICGLVLAIGMLADTKKPLATLLGGVVALVAMWTALRFDHARATETWAGWQTAGAASAAMGIVGVIAMVPRHLSIASDPVERAIKLLPGSLDPEVRGLCTRSVAIWTDIKAKLEDSDPSASLVREAVLKTLEVATTSTETTQPTSDDDLGRRMEDLDRRIATATDDEVRTQYTQARAALSDQKAYRDRIRQHRERLVARLHNHLAALEKFQLAVGVTTSQRLQGQQLQELSRDVAVSGEALSELPEVGEATL